MGCEVGALFPVWSKYSAYIQDPGFIGDELENGARFGSIVDGKRENRTLFLVVLVG